ncbi:hypothetical protein LJC40_03960 [Synergistaceae bacterium OttesenSCG-928-D05]|nr:hypothetical protein [Synergistaceae bacterium OttesenSCG-928-D05]
MNCFLIMAVRLEQRNETAVAVQKVLTEFGCAIRTRLGLHDQAPDNTCSPSGLLILQLCCEEAEAQKLEAALQKIDGVRAKLVNLAA